MTSFSSTTGSAEMPLRAICNAASRNGVSGMAVRGRCVMMSPDGQLARQLHLGEHRQCGECRGVRRRDDLLHDLRARQQSRERAEHLKVSRGHARRRDDHQQRRARAEPPRPQLAHDVAWRDADGDRHFANGVRSEVDEERALPHCDHVFAPQLRDALREPLGIGDRARCDQPVEQRGRRFAQRARVEGHDDRDRARTNSVSFTACACGRDRPRRQVAWPRPSRPPRTRRSSPPRCPPSRR